MDISHILVIEMDCFLFLVLSVQCRRPGLWLNVITHVAPLDKDKDKGKGG